jgi:hypothetical protein
MDLHPYDIIRHVITRHDNSQKHNLNVGSCSTPNFDQVFLRHLTHHNRQNFILVGE